MVQESAYRQSVSMKIQCKNKRLRKKWPLRWEVDVWRLISGSCTDFPFTSEV
jgi:hypothetical protein